VKADALHAQEIAKKVVKADVSSVLERGAVALCAKENRRLSHAISQEEKHAKAEALHAKEIAKRIAKADVSSVIERGALAQMNKESRRMDIAMNTE
jgi:hypothetical protein